MHSPRTSSWFLAQAAISGNLSCRRRHQPLLLRSQGRRHRAQWHLGLGPQHGRAGGGCQGWRGWRGWALTAGYSSPASSLQFHLSSTGSNCSTTHFPIVVATSWPRTPGWVQADVYGPPVPWAEGRSVGGILLQSLCLPPPWLGGRWRSVCLWPPVSWRPGQVCGHLSPPVPCGMAE